jgi:acyl-CoA synthetase (AMP-forming)/AMP-acid ligase II
MVKGETGMNIGTLFTKSARSFPDELAICFGDKEWTYAAANERINRLANGFKNLGLKKGDNVSILQYNCPQAIETLFACFKAGLCAVPINFRLHPKEYSYIIDHSDSAAIVFGDDFRDDLNLLGGELPKVQHFICLSDPLNTMVYYEDLVKNNSPRFEDVDVDGDDVAWLFYTSGTTGLPKAAMMTHSVLLAMAMNFYADVSPLGPGDAILHAAPISHGSGVYSIPNVGKAANNVILETRSFDPKVVCETIQKRRITNMFAAPTMVKLLVTYPDIDRYDLNSLKALVYGGAPMYLEDLKESMRKLPNCLVQIYGQGEAPMTISYLRKEDHILDGTSGQMEKLKSAGIPRTNVEVKVFDQNDNEMPRGTMGEVVVRGDVVMKAYWKNPQATEETLRHGWLHTGDLGYMDERDYIYLVDRSKDMLISGGENIYTREVEDVILLHPAVYEVAVFGVPDEKWGEAVKAVVSFKPGLKATERELIDFCSQHLAGYKKPKSIEFRDVLPKNAYGKILKRELRETYWQGQTKRI